MWIHNTYIVMFLHWGAIGVKRLFIDPPKKNWDRKAERWSD